MELRPYQARAVNDARQAFAGGAKACLLVLPTGGGKTFTGGHMIARALERGGRVTWFAHRTELIEQAAESFRRLGLRVGVTAVPAGSLPRFEGKGRRIIDHRHDTRQPPRSDA